MFGTYASVTQSNKSGYKSTGYTYWVIFQLNILGQNLLSVQVPPLVDYLKKRRHHFLDRRVYLLATRLRIFLFVFDSMLYGVRPSDVSMSDLQKGSERNNQSSYKLG